MATNNNSLEGLADFFDSILAAGDSQKSVDAQPPQQVATSSPQTPQSQKYLASIPKARNDAANTHESMEDVAATHAAKRTYNASDEMQKANKQMTEAQLIGGNEQLNTNKKSAADTLRYSRLADKLNNTAWTPGAVGGSYYQHGGFNSTSYLQPNVKNIETEETRQQERARQYETKARDIDFNIQELQQQYQYLKAQGVDKAQLDAWYQSTLQGILQRYEQNEYMFKSQYDLETKQQYAEVADALAKKNRALGSYFMQIVNAGIPIDPLTATMQEVQQAAYNAYNAGQITFDQYVDAMKGASYIGGMLGMQTSLGAIAGVTSSLDDVVPAVKGEVK